MNFFNNIGNAVENTIDLVQDVFQPNKRPAAEGTVLADGEVTHNVDLSAFEGPERAEAEKIVASHVEKIVTLEEKLEEVRGDGDIDAIRHYSSQLSEARQEFTDAKWQLEHDDIDLFAIGALITGGPIVSLAVAGFRGPDTSDRIEEASENAPLAEIATAAPDEATTGGSDAVFGNGEPSGANASGNLTSMTPEELANAYQADPEGFFEQLRGLPSEDRNMIMMMMQQHIQEENRLFSLMTNMQSAMHDTEKALISNLRV